MIAFEKESIKKLQRLLFRSIITNNWSEFNRFITKLMLMGKLIGAAKAFLSTYNNSPPPNDIHLSDNYKSIALFKKKIPQLWSRARVMTKESKQEAFYITNEERKNVLKEVKNVLVNHLKINKDEPFSATQQVAKIAKNISLHRSEMIVRTNLLSAINKSQMDNVNNEVVLIRLDEIRDKRTRGNPSGLYPNTNKNMHPHWQMDGFIETPNNPVWKTITPPNGYNCRATLNFIGFDEAYELGLINKNHIVNQAILNKLNKNKWSYISSGVYPDKGFK